MARAAHAEDNEVAQGITNVGLCDSGDTKVLNKGDMRLSFFSPNGFTPVVIGQAEKE